MVSPGSSFANFGTSNSSFCTMSFSPSCSCYLLSVVISFLFLFLILRLPSSAHHNCIYTTHAQLSLPIVLSYTHTYIHHLPLLPPPSSLSLLIFCLSPKTHLTYYNSHMHPRVECYLLHASFSFSTSSFCLFTIIFLSLVLCSSPAYTFSGPHRAVKPITASFSPLCSSCVISHIHSSHLETIDSSVHTQYS